MVKSSAKAHQLGQITDFVVFSAVNSNFGDVNGNFLVTPTLDFVAFVEVRDGCLEFANEDG